MGWFGDILWGQNDPNTTDLRDVPELITKWLKYAGIGVLVVGGLIAAIFMFKLANR